MIQEVQAYLYDKFGNAEVTKLSDKVTNIIVTFRDITVVYTFTTDESTHRTQCGLQLRSSTEFKFNELGVMESFISSMKVILESYYKVDELVLVSNSSVNKLRI